MKPYTNFYSKKKYACNGWFSEQMLVVVKEGLEGCMQHAIDTSPYTHRVYTWIPYKNEMAMAIEYVASTLILASMLGTIIPS